MTTRNVAFNAEDSSFGLVFESLKVYRDCPSDIPYNQIDVGRLLSHSQISNLIIYSV